MQKKVEDVTDAELWDHVQDITPEDLVKGLGDTPDDRRRREAHRPLEFEGTSTQRVRSGVAHRPAAHRRGNSSAVVDDDDPFVVAEEDALRGAPVYETPEENRKYEAYVVFFGRRMGVFRTWSSAWAQVIHFSGNCYKGFTTLANAREAWNHALLTGTWGNPLQFRAHEAREARRLPVFEGHVVQGTDRPQNAVPLQRWLHPQSESFTDSTSIPRRPASVASTKRGKHEHVADLTQHLNALNLGSHSSSSKPRQHTASPTASARRQAREALECRMTRGDRPPRKTREEAKEDYAWYVIVAGAIPGVYPRVEDAVAALGSSPRAEVQMFASESQASIYYTRLLRGGCIVTLG